MKLLYKFYFNDGVNMSRVETQLIESLMTSVDIFGEQEMKLSATYLVAGREAVLDAYAVAGVIPNPRSPGPGAAVRIAARSPAELPGELFGVPLVRAVEAALITADRT